jgi:hypothetical protein
MTGSGRRVLSKFTFVSLRRHRARVRRAGTYVIASFLLFAGLAISTRSTSAGATQPSNADPLLATRAGLSQYVYVLWSTSCGSLECFHLQRLDDGGRNSTTGSLPTPLAPSKNYYTHGGLEQLVFADVNDGYALVSSPKGSATLYATFDGARSWHREAFVEGEAPESITASNGAFYAVGSVSCPTGHVDCEIWRISRSAVGSHKWHAVSRSYNFTHDANYPFVAAFGSRVFITAQEQAEPGHTLFGASKNNGRSFKVADVPNLSSVNGCELQPASSDTIWAECDDGMMSGEIEISTDGGDHWRVVYDNRPGAPFDFGTVDPVSSDLTYSDDAQYAGQLWSLRAGAKRSTLAGTLPYPQVASLAFTNIDDGLALSATIGPQSRQVLYETIDAGKHWKRLFM